MSNYSLDAIVSSMLANIKNFIFSRLWRKDRVAQGFQKYHHSIRREILHKNGDFQDFVRFHRNWEKRVVPVWDRSLKGEVTLDHRA